MARPFKGTGHPRNCLQDLLDIGGSVKVEEFMRQSRGYKEQVDNVKPDPDAGRDYGDENHFPRLYERPDGHVAWDRTAYPGAEDGPPKQYVPTPPVDSAYGFIEPELLDNGRTTPARGIDPTTKLSNPKDVVGSTKVPMHLWPAVASVWGALAFLDGMLKYGRNNWREDGVRATIYIDAIERHLKRYKEGEDVDEDSGLHPLAHLLASAAIIVDAEASGTLVDDRNYKGTWFPKFLADASVHVKRLVAKHVGKTPRHYTIKDNR